MRACLLTALSVLALALPAKAFAQNAGQSPITQTSQRPPQVPSPKPSLGLRGVGTLQMTAMDSTATFNALTGSPNVSGFGGAADVVNLFSRVFVRAGMAQEWTEGSRVVVLDDGSVHQTGVPLTLGLLTVELGAGWRHSPRRHPRFAWYAGAGVAWIQLSSESPVPLAGENDSDSGTGAVVFAGFDHTIWKLIIGGVEVQYRSVQDAIGTGGVSAAMGDTGLGGATIRGMIGLKFGR